MHTPEDVPATTDSPAAPPSRPLPRLADLVATARARRGSAEGLREAVARRVRFLRAAATSQTERIRTLVTPRDRDPAHDEVCAMAHVLRVRSRLTPEEQLAFDQLVGDYTESVLGLLVARSDDEALEAVRRQLAAVAHTMPASTEGPASDEVPCCDPDER